MSVQSVFSSPVFGLVTDKSKGQAARGFSQVFAAILSKELRTSGMNENEGPLATGGGASGDVYGAFFDQVMGRVLANSPAMKPLNRAIERELATPLRQAPTRNNKTIAVASNRDKNAISSSMPGKSDINLPSDSLGPLLLPPEPTGVAPLLPPPPRLEG
ncbi:MAG TPA: hypothetical protein VJ728_11025 [Candidatus Binataceae bacterium]|nr:hypothetical protein [Candidatus Binataceae bacterium]